MAFILVANNDNVKYGVIEGYVKTTEDIASLQTTYEPGSTVTVIETGDKYVLTHDKHWALVHVF